MNDVLSIVGIMLVLVYVVVGVIIAGFGTPAIGFWPSLLGGIVWPYTVARELFTKDQPGTTYVPRRGTMSHTPEPRPPSPERSERSWLYQHWHQSPTMGFFLVADSGNPRGENFYVSIIDGKVNVDWPPPLTKQAFDTDAIKWIALRLQEAGMIAEMQRAGIFK